MLNKLDYEYNLDFYKLISQGTHFIIKLSELNCFKSTAVEKTKHYGIKPDLIV